MQCPHCENVSLDEITVQGGIEVDECPRCRGVWFDKGEFGSYLHFSKDVPELTALEEKAEETSRSCPRCRKTLKERQFVPESPVRIDVCGDCDGVWLDGGELAQLEDLTKDPDNRKLRLMRAVWDLRKKAGIGSPMVCPKCRQPSLNDLNTGEGVSVDFCSRCKGVWFEKGELARMVELSKDVPDLDASLKASRPTNLSCPKCKEMLKEFRYSKLKSLLVDYCTKCEGLWLDAGELSTVEGLATVLESPGSRLGRALKQLHDEGYILGGTR